MLILVLLPLVFLFACFALNACEHPMHKPGIARPLTICLIVTVAWLLWPLYGGLVAWIAPR